MAVVESFSMGHDLTSLRKLGWDSSTRHDFPPLEWALNPIRQLLVDTDMRPFLAFHAYLVILEKMYYSCSWVERIVWLLLSLHSLHNISWYHEIWTTAERLSGQIPLWWSEWCALRVQCLQQLDPTLNPWQGLKNTPITYFVLEVIWTTLTSSLRHGFLCLGLGSCMVRDRGNITTSHITSFKIPQCLAYLSLSPQSTPSWSSQFLLPYKFLSHIQAVWCCEMLNFARFICGTRFGATHWNLVCASVGTQLKALTSLCLESIISYFIWVE